MRTFFLLLGVLLALGCGQDQAQDVTQNGSKFVGPDLTGCTCPATADSLLIYIEGGACDDSLNVFELYVTSDRTPQSYARLYRSPTLETCPFPQNATYTDLISLGGDQYMYRWSYDWRLYWEGTITVEAEVVVGCDSDPWQCSDTICDIFYPPTDPCNPPGGGGGGKHDPEN